MRYLLITLTLLFSLNGCQDKKHLDEEAQAKHDAKIAQQARAEVLAEFEQKRLETEKEKKQLAQKKEAEKHSFDAKNVPLNQVGIQVDKDSITIDTNKTKTFLDNLSKKLEGHIKKISDDLEKGIVDSKEAGIEINKEHINIDLNKTQNILEEWGKKIQIFVNEFDKVSKKHNDEHHNSN